MSSGSHLTAGALEALAARCPPTPAEASHLEACEACRAQLDAVQAADAALVASPRFLAIQANLRAGPGSPAGRPAGGVCRSRPRSAATAWPRIGLWTVAAAGLAGGLMLALPAAPPEPWPAAPAGGITLKGSGQLRLTRADGTPAPSPLRPGEIVHYHVGSTSPWLLLVERTGNGPLGVLWPAASRKSARVPPDGRLDPPYRVTPGSYELLAVFSELPLSADAVLPALEAEVQACRAAGVAWPCPGRGPLPGEKERDHLMVEVQ